MSIKAEQYCALYKTRQFLRDLLTVDDYPKTRKEMRKRADECLHHFPFLTSNGEPIFSQDGFPCPKLNRPDLEERREFVEKTRDVSIGEYK